MKMKNIKNIDLFCTSPSSTSIYTSTTPKSKSMHNYKLLTSKLRDHYNTFNSPCKGISQLPITPQTLNHNNHIITHNSRRKSSADVTDLITGHSSRYLLGDSPFLDSLSPRSHETATPSPLVRLGRSEERGLRKSRSQTGPRLGSVMVIEADDEKDKDKKKKKMTSLVEVNPSDNDKRVINKSSHSSNYCDYYGDKKKSMRQYYYSRNDSPDAPSPNQQQVVVLRVSLNCKCKGCEAKLRKHVSKMEGVKSFSIDLENKKVTVIGNVTPSDVLTGVSKVKNARFWPSPITLASSTSSSSSSTSSTTDFSY